MQPNKHKSGVVAGILLPMGLTCLFAFCSLALALMGGRAYKQIQGSIDDSFGSTVAANYLRTKLSQNNTAGAVSLRQEGAFELLVIASEVSERPYETRIYVNEGQLMESFVAGDTPFNASSGMKIASLSSCTFAIAEDGLFTAELTSPEGAKTRTAFALAEGGGV